VPSESEGSDDCFFYLFHLFYLFIFMKNKEAKAWGHLVVVSVTMCLRGFLFSVHLVIVNCRFLSSHIW
jgi:hypothetical protein